MQFPCGKSLINSDTKQLTGYQNLSVKKIFIRLKKNSDTDFYKNLSVKIETSFVSGITAYFFIRMIKTE